MNYEPPPDPSEIAWNVEREGRAWDKDEVSARYELTPEKTELIDGKLFWSDADRLRMLGLLLENCGANAAVRFGDPGVWRQAVAGLSDPEATLRHKVETARRRWDKSEDEAAERGVKYSPDLTTVETRTDAVHREGDAAFVHSTRTLRHRRYEKISENQWRSLPDVVEVERWRETWTQANQDWRLGDRERVEGPWQITEGT